MYEEVSIPALKSVILGGQVPQLRLAERGAPVTGALVVAFGRGLSMYFRSGVSACHERKRIALKPA